MKSIAEQADYWSVNAISTELPSQRSRISSWPQTDEDRLVDLIVGGSAFTTPVTRSKPPAEVLPLEESTTVGRYGWLSAIASVVSIRLLILLVGIWSLHSISSTSQIDHANASGTPWMAFDGGFYRFITVHGYPKGPNVPYHIAYFPLFPFLARTLVPFMVPSSALITVSNLCSVIGLLVMYGWAKSITNARTAYFSTLLLAAYPGAVFYCAGLTEGMFMMFVAITMYLLTAQRLWTAAIVCAIATACRPTAVALSATVFIWTIFNSRELPLKVQIRKAILIGMISVVGGACYQGFMWHRYHRFDAYKIAEDKWDVTAGPLRQPTDDEALREVSGEWQPSTIVPTVVSRPGTESPGSSQFPRIHPEPARYSLAFFASRMKTSQAWNRLITVALLIMLVGAVIKRSAVPRLLLLTPLVIFLMAYLPNFGLRASSILRYESAGVPLFVVLGWHLAKPKRQPILAFVVVASLGLEVYYAYLFSRGSWVG